jgi:hypothetical protein
MPKAKMAQKPASMNAIKIPEKVLRMVAVLWVIVILPPETKPPFQLTHSPLYT